MNSILCFMQKIGLDTFFLGIRWIVPAIDHGLFGGRIHLHTLGVMVVPLDHVPDTILPTGDQEQ